VGVPFERLLRCYRRTVDFDGTIRQVPGPQTISSLLGTGATVIVNRFDRADISVNQLITRLRADRATDVCANAYLSASESQSFGWHDDDHDVLVLQLAGTKRWEFAPADPNGSAPERLGTAVELAAGDALFVPRGVAHAVSTTSSDPSLHLSVALFPLTVDQVVESAVRQVAKQEGLGVDLAHLNQAERSAVLASALDEARALLEGLPLVPKDAEENDVDPLSGDEAM
jgi:ribosomal protein L16 Arg81 hydroxylase